MNRRLRETILDAIWPDNLPPDLRVFAALDGAQDPRIFYEMQSTFCEHDCLYAGSLPMDLQRAAPYLVQLEREDRLTRFLLENGWGRNWGIFLRTDIRFKDLRNHLRSFLRVKDEKGSRLIFRYYDPRVFRAYLPTCTPSELQKTFGPIQSFVMEGDDFEDILEMKFDQRELQTNRRRAE